MRAQERTRRPPDSEAVQNLRNLRWTFQLLTPSPAALIPLQQLSVNLRCYALIDFEPLRLCILVPQSIGPVLGTIPQHAVRIASAEEPSFPPRRPFLTATAVPKKAAQDGRHICSCHTNAALPRLASVLLKLDFYWGAGWYGGCGDRDVAGSSKSQSELYR